MKVIFSLTGKNLESMTLFHHSHFFCRENSHLCAKHPTANNQGRAQEVYDILIYLFIYFHFNLSKILVPLSGRKAE